MGIDPLAPLRIIVRRGHWEAVIDTPVPTIRDRYLVNEIKIAGGIDANVPPGMYLFNITPSVVGDVVTLTPDKEWRSKFV